MKWWCGIVLALCISSNACVSNPAAPDSSSTQLSLRVVNAQTDGALGYVSVAITTDAGTEVADGETSLSGYFSATVPRNAMLWVELNAVGFHARREPYRF